MTTYFSEFGSHHVGAWHDRGVVLAPPASRGWVERTRSAMGGTARAALSAMALGVAVCASPVPAYSGAIMPLKAPRVAEAPGDPLVEKLAAVRETSGQLEATLGRRINSASLTAAEKVARLLPRVPGETQVGLDDEGNVYFHFVQGAKDAYLTIEPGTLHLLVMEPGAESIYLDNVQFPGDALPRRVSTAFKHNLGA